MSDIVSVRRVVRPIFSEMREASTGTGWVVGYLGPHYSNGDKAVHGHSAFATQQEAVEEYQRLRGKMK